MAEIEVGISRAVKHISIRFTNEAKTLVIKEEADFWGVREDFEHFAD